MITVFCSDEHFLKISIFFLHNQSPTYQCYTWELQDTKRNESQPSFQGNVFEHIKNQWESQSSHWSLENNKGIQYIFKNECQISFFWVSIFTCKWITTYCEWLSYQSVSKLPVSQAEKSQVEIELSDWSISTSLHRTTSMFIFQR